MYGCMMMQKVHIFSREYRNCVAIFLTANKEFLQYMKYWMQEKFVEFFLVLLYSSSALQTIYQVFRALEGPMYISSSQLCVFGSKQFFGQQPSSIPMSTVLIHLPCWTFSKITKTFSIIIRAELGISPTSKLSEAKLTSFFRVVDFDKASSSYTASFFFTSQRSSLSYNNSAKYSAFVHYFFHFQTPITIQPLDQF